MKGGKAHCSPATQDLLAPGDREEGRAISSGAYYRRPTASIDTDHSVAWSAVTVIWFGAAPGVRSIPSRPPLSGQGCDPVPYATVAPDPLSQRKNNVEGSVTRTGTLLSPLPRIAVSTSPLGNGEGATGVAAGDEGASLRFAVRFESAPVHAVVARPMTARTTAQGRITRIMVPMPGMLARTYRFSL